METLNELYTNITKFWSTPGQCVLGHLTHVPQTLYGGLGSRRAPPREDRLEGNILDLGTFRSILSRSRVVSLLYLVSKFSLADVISKNVFSLQGVVASSSFGMLNQGRRITQPNHARRERQLHQTHHDSVAVAPSNPSSGNTAITGAIAGCP